MTDSFEKWPVSLSIEEVMASPHNPGLSIFLVSGVMNVKQSETLREGLPQLTVHETSGDIRAVAAVLSRQQLSEAHDYYAAPSKSWRGQYYVIANAFVNASSPHFSSSANTAG